MESSERNNNSIYQLICECVAQIKQECMPLLLQMIETVVKLMSNGPVQFISLMNKENTILIRSLFFYYSFSPVRLSFCFISFLLGRYIHLPFPLQIEKFDCQSVQNHQKGEERRTPIFVYSFHSRPFGLPSYRNGDGNRKWTLLHATHRQRGGRHITENA